MIHAQAIAADYAARVAKLSAKERDVLVLLAKDMSCSEIGEVLAMSPHTAADHRKHIYAKLEVHGACGAAVIAAKVGLV